MGNLRILGLVGIHNLISAQIIEIVIFTSVSKLHRSPLTGTSTLCKQKDAEANRMVYLTWLLLG